jgi:tetratricopeptide (TPR) repeat protein
MLALHLLTGGKYDSAIEQWKRTFEFAPTFPEAHFNLSRAYWGKGLYQEAITEAQKAASYMRSIVGMVPAPVASNDTIRASRGLGFPLVPDAWGDSNVRRNIRQRSSTSGGSGRRSRDR